MDLKALEQRIIDGAGLADLGPMSIGPHLARGKVSVLYARLDVSVQGGGVGQVNLFDAVEGGNGTAILPAGAIIKQVTVKTNAALASGGAATVSIGANGAADLLAATAFGSFSGLQAGIPAGAAASMVTMAAKAPLTATIAAAPLTAGQLDVIVEYYFPAGA